MINPEAICGNCSKPYKDHFFEVHRSEDVIYCFEDTNGDVWDDNPSDTDIANWLEFEFPRLYKKVVNSWKKEHGHF